MKRVTYLSFLAALVLSPAVNAQTTTSTTTTTSGAVSSAASFDQLSAGNQMIARSLMDAQVAPASGGQIWTLDQIAAAKSGTGWGNVFASMKADGLLDADNLGQVVSSYARSTHSPITGSVAAEAGMNSTESTAAETDTDAEATSTPDDAAETEAGTEAESTSSAQAAQTVESGGNATTFAGLSTGNQKIARALMDAQTLPAGGTTQLWTLDQIAAAKSGAGWGGVFQQMHSEGLINAKNLGQVVSGYETGGSVAASETATTATNASTTAATSLMENGNDSHGQSGEAGMQGSTASESGLTTASGHAAAMGDAGITTAEDQMANPGADASISASDSVTTGAGAAIGMDHAAMAPGAGSGVSASLTGGAGGGPGLGADMSQMHGAGHGH